MDGEMVLVFTADSYTDYLWCSSFLEAAEIKFYAKNAELQNLFGAGMLGTGYNVLIGPIKIYVAQKDSAEAIEIIKSTKDTDIKE